MSKENLNRAMIDHQRNRGATDNPVHQLLLDRLRPPAPPEARKKPFDVGAVLDAMTPEARNAFALHFEAHRNDEEKE